MPTPITQSEVDVEMDRLAMEPRIDEQEAFEMQDFVDDSTDGHRMFPSSSTRSHIPSESLPSSQLSRLVSSGGTTPLIMNEWQRWITTTPNVIGGDLITEIEALRKLRIDGLSTTEINFPRAAIGFNYEHWAKCKRIYIEMRLHRLFLENGKVVVQIGQKDCPLTADKAALLLQLFQIEADEQKKVPGNTTTTLARVLQQLPKMVEALKVFTASMDVPNLQKTSLNQSSSSEDKASKDNSGTTQSESIVGSQPQPTADFIISPFDYEVPYPRTSGCRFNGSGWLITSLKR